MKKKTTTAPKAAPAAKPKAAKPKALKSGHLKAKALIDQNYDGDKVPFVAFDDVGLEIDGKQARELAAWLKEYAAWSDGQKKPKAGKGA